MRQQYNKKRLIAVMNAKHLCQIPHARNGDASSLHQLLNHRSNRMNALSIIVECASVRIHVESFDVSHTRP